MIAVDTNILIYATMEELARHAAARACVERLMNGREAWAIPWPCLHEFLATVTRPRLFKQPLTTEQALSAMEVIASSPTLQLIGERVNHFEVLSDLMKAAQVVGGAVHDARIAAICISNNVAELWTADRDFARFTSLAHRNPL
jgi:uncharacterized protein